MRRPEILCIVQRGCGACEEYVPRLRKALKGSGVKLTVHDLARDRNARRVAEQYSIRVTPTTLLETKRGTLIRRVGGLDKPEIDDLIRLAVA